MSYTPHTWVEEETITHQKLNAMEQGIAGSGSSTVMICNLSYNGDDWVLDKTTQEIYDAITSGTPVYIKYYYGSMGVDYETYSHLCPVVYMYSYETTEVIRICASTAVRTGNIGGYGGMSVPAIMNFVADGMDDYPVYVTRTYSANNTYYNGLQ